MSRIHRAVEKADREGLLTWTKGNQGGAAATLQEPPLHAPEPPTPARARAPRPPVWNPPAVDPASWETPQPTLAETIRLSPMFVAATAPGSAAAEHYRLL